MPDIPQLLADHCSFWNHLTVDEQRMLVANTHRQTFQPGEFVYGGTSDCLGVIFVLKGQLRTYLLSDKGKEVTLYHLFPQDMCILSASCVLESIAFDVFIDARKKTDILLIDAHAFHRLSEHNMYVQNFGYRLATQRFSDVMWAMQQILFMGVDQRLAVFLLNSSDETPSDTPGALKTTHEQIAKSIGTAREVVTRLLKQLANEQIVALSRGGITLLDKDKLRHIAHLSE